MHICVRELTNIGSDNGLSPGQRQAIIWTNAGLLSVGLLGTNCSEILTHWGRVTHICVISLIIIGSDNGLLPGRRQAIIWTNAGILFFFFFFSTKLYFTSFIHSYTFWQYIINIVLRRITLCINNCTSGQSFFSGILLIWPLRTKFNEMLIEIQTFSFKKMHWKMSSGKWRVFVSASMCSLKFIYIFIQENAFEIVVWEMAAILSCPQFVKFQ